MILDKTFFVERLTPNSSNSAKEQYTAHSGFLFGGIASNAIQANLQPASPEKTVLAEGILGKTFSMFTRASGVVEGFRLTHSGTSNKYVVRGREYYDYGVENHAELIVVRDEDQ